MTIEFVEFPKIYRLGGPIIVTEKIDGTNACIIIEGNEIAAQSRTMLITPENDNFGFARWVRDNKDMLIEILGEGRHFGEWHGKGIQRGYGIAMKRFALFNTTRWNREEVESKSHGTVTVVPVLYTGEFDTEAFKLILESMRTGGSVMYPGFMRPEGIAIYDTRSGTGYKKTLERDDTGKLYPKDKHGNAIIPA